MLAISSSSPSSPRIGRASKTSGGFRHVSACPDAASWIARHTRSRVHGMSTWRDAEVARARRPPRSAPRASNRSCAASPMPFAPSALQGVGVSVFATSKVGHLGRGRASRSRRASRSSGCRPRRRRTAPTAPARCPARSPPCCWPATSSGLSDPPAVVDRDVAHGLDAAGVECRPRRPRRAHRTGTSHRAGLEVGLRAATPGARVGGELAPREHAVGHARRRRRRRRRPSSTELMSPAVASSSGGGELACPATTTVVGRAEHARARRAAATASRRCRRPRGTTAVSDCTKRTCSIGTPSRSATIIANDVAWPWPCAGRADATSSRHRRRRRSRRRTPRPRRRR